MNQTKVEAAEVLCNHPEKEAACQPLLLPHISIPLHALMRILTYCFFSSILYV